jgi:hypothetical protein
LRSTLHNVSSASSKLLAVNQPTAQRAQAHMCAMNKGITPKHCVNLSVMVSLFGPITDLSQTQCVRFIASREMAKLLHKSLQASAAKTQTIFHLFLPTCGKTFIKLFVVAGAYLKLPELAGALTGEQHAVVLAGTWHAVQHVVTLCITKQTRLSYQGYKT